MANIILSIPEDDWQLLDSMLQLDAKSSSTDRELRDRIAAALGRIDYINDDIQQLVDQYSISGYGVGGDIQNLQAVTGINPQSNDSDDEDDGPDLSSYGAWLEDTGKDDSFQGDPDPREEYEAACKEAGVVPDWTMEGE